MTKIYDFFQNEGETTIETVDEIDLLRQAEKDTIAILELYNLNAAKVKKLNRNELFTLHNALIRVKYFQETGKVLTEKGLK